MSTHSTEYAIPKSKAELFAHYVPYPIIFLVTKRTTVSAIKNNIKYLNKIKEKKSTLIKSYHKLFKKSFYFLQFIIKLIVLLYFYRQRKY